MKEKPIERFARFIKDVIYDARTDGKLVLVVARILYYFSFVFRAIVELRFWLYQKRIMQDTPLGCRVIVVGNLTMGGTGKTPVVEKMARVMASHGRKVAILSRGYKSKKEPFYKKWIRFITQAPRPLPRVVSDGNAVLLPASIAGDEPYMLARNLVKYGVRVVVDRDRVYAGMYAIKNLGADIIILDDGLQYLPLKGSLNLLLVDKTNPFGNHCVIPRGILREPVSHLWRGDFIFLTKSDGKPAPELYQLIRQYNQKAEIIECRHAPKWLCPVFERDGNANLPLETLKDARVATFSGIATPDKFEEFVRQYGASIVYNRRFFDHYNFTRKDIDAVFAGAVAAGAKFVVTTEKDMVRLARDLVLPLPLYFLRLEIEILSDKETFDAAVERICN